MQKTKSQGQFYSCVADLALWYGNQRIAAIGVGVPDVGNGRLAVLFRKIGVDGEFQEGAHVLRKVELNTSAEGNAIVELGNKPVEGQNAQIQSAVGSPRFFEVGIQGIISPYAEEVVQSIAYIGGDVLLGTQGEGDIAKFKGYSKTWNILKTGRSGYFGWEGAYGTTFNVVSGLGEQGKGTVFLCGLYKSYGMVAVQGVAGAEGVVPALEACRCPPLYTKGIALAKSGIREQQQGTRK